MRQNDIRLVLQVCILNKPQRACWLSSAVDHEPITAKQRLAIENQYFQSSPWKEEALSADRVGVASLQRFLQKLLEQHIERELPRVREDIKDIINRLEQEIAALGDERPTTGHLRVFLSRLAMRFHNLTSSALDGNYFDSDTTFFDDTNVEHHSSRIRALTHRLNTEFSNHMRENGQKMKVITSRSDHKDEPEGPAEEDQILVTEQEMKDWVKEVCSLSGVLTIPDSQPGLRQQQRERVTRQLQSCSHV